MDKLIFITEVKNHLFQNIEIETYQRGITLQINNNKRKFQVFEKTTTVP